MAPSRAGTLAGRPRLTQFHESFLIVLTKRTTSPWTRLSGAAAVNTECDGACQSSTPDTRCVYPLQMTCPHHRWASPPRCTCYLNEQEPKVDRMPREWWALGHTQPRGTSYRRRRFIDWGESFAMPGFSNGLRVLVVLLGMWTSPTRRGLSMKNNRHLAGRRTMVGAGAVAA